MVGAADIMGGIVAGTEAGDITIGAITGKANSAKVDRLLRGEFAPIPCSGEISNRSNDSVRAESAQGHLRHASHNWWNVSAGSGFHHW
jgi:hypothetical protein